MSRKIKIITIKLYCIMSDLMFKLYNTSPPLLKPHQKVNFNHAENKKHI